MTRTALVATVAAAAIAVSACQLPPALSAPAPTGGPPAAGDTAVQLAELTVAPRGGDGDYEREAFHHWIEQGQGCDTRAVALQRADTVDQHRPCPIKTGAWTSPYDGATWTRASDVDIDHVVPLAAAWRSGASGWTDAEREAFANDLDGPQLVVVTDNVNQEKGDKSPDQWKPPETGYWCTYAAMWVQVKAKYRLTVTAAEVEALNTMLARCEPTEGSTR
ncbi:hypothetical protein CFN78_28125 [Amycolatopsis antarctica]|uniref:GmrSD restriction endonucleases C-terminal domain-containing protein n=1 Tax=Amycolatopsis antarctica TaxID=1854586 RepID=A0A263CUV7_9PSEU|nr:HNH endonuclease family protein [Amycolatopsis antarctica]OZM69894.1 hypothetical protein CFN78_28125 [Amycolatopsis antarctica]